MDLEIHPKKVRFWETSFPIIPESGLLMTAGLSLHLRKIDRQKENNSIVHHTVDDIILKYNKKLSAEDEAHGNIDSLIDEDNLYEIDKITIYEKK